MDNIVYTNKENLINKPMCLIVIGFAGSGKTSFVKAFQQYMIMNDKPVYTINLDPAVHSLPYEPNIDIRDTIQYKEVMKDYNLGPNGAILTSLNLFSTEMKGVVELIDKYIGKINHVINDTPGQIEVFQWSASGKIITQTLSSSFPTAIVYVIDCSRSVNPITFMANMFYASGVAIEYELPFIMVMNKTDIIDCSYIDKWMGDVSVFLDELDSYDVGYMKSVIRQMCLALDSFYENLMRCGVSSVTGDGLDKFHELLKLAREEYFDVYLKQVLPQKIAEGCDLKESIFIGDLNEVDVESADDDSEDDDEESNVKTFSEMV